MTYEEAKKEAKSRLGEYLASLGVDVEKARRGNITCPICGGRGFQYYPNNRNGKGWHCFSCGEHGDVFDLYGLKNGLADKGERFRGVYATLGIKPDGGTASSSSGKKVKGKAQGGSAAARADGVGFKEHEQDKEAVMEEERQEEEKLEFHNNKRGYKYINDCSARLSDERAVNYLKSRGFDDDFIDSLSLSFGIGYDPEWKNPANEEQERYKGQEALIIPAGEGYVARLFHPYTNKKGITQKAFNVRWTDAGMGIFCGRQYIKNGHGEKPLYVVEGWADALSIIAVGGAAVSLNSASMRHRFIRDYAPDCKKNNIKLVIAFDNDTAGKNALEKFVPDLSETGVDFFVGENPAGGYKDANEAFVNDRDGLKKRVITTNARYLSLKYGVAAHEQDFLSFMRERRPLISSGFKSLDKAISGWDGGGLPVGLYVIGAISSLGKTTFALQVADQMAAQGQDVLIFSLEMSRTELIGKSVSRHSFFSLPADRRKTIEKSLNIGRSLANASEAFTWSDYRDLRLKQDHDLLGGDNLFEKEKIEKRMEDAAHEYFTTTGDHVFIEEGRMEGTSLEHIKKRVSEHVRDTGNKPVVIIDYLQMIKPPEGMEGATDKAITDKNILACKVMSRDFNTPVIVISSFSRSAYFTNKGLASFKESGAIEYTADVVLALQYKSMEGAKDEKDGAEKEQEAKKRNVREVKVNILKNRSGGMTDTPTFTFIPMFNTFVEYEPDTNAAKG